MAIWVEERVSLQVFTMHNRQYGASFHGAYLRTTYQVLLEAHELALACRGGDRTAKSATVSSGNPWHSTPTPDWETQLFLDD